MVKYLSLIGLLMTTACVNQPLSNSKQPQPVVSITTSGNTDIEFAVELAQTTSERIQGLMYREELPQDQGMLFIFPQDDDHGFWMKNTYIPLDILFINTDLEIVGIAPDTEPLSEETIQIGTPSRYVLEINAGLSARMNIDVGNVVHWKNFTP